MIEPVHCKVMSTDRITPAIGTIREADLAKRISDPALPTEDATERRHRADMPSRREVPEDGHGMSVTVLICDLPISQP
jgi:hypothetical protein